MQLTYLVFCLIAIAITSVDSNSEGDALHVLRTNLNDPNNVLQSWDPTLINPCTWYHVTCNMDNSVTRVDLGNAGLSGTLTPSLGQLANLQYLNLYSNNITGVIPTEFGNLTRLIRLDLSNNHLSGVIPSSLSYLRPLRFLSLNGNHLSGTIPLNLIQLVLKGDLQLLNVSNNNLAGTVRNTRGNADGYRTATIIQDPRAPK